MLTDEDSVIGHDLVMHKDGSLKLKLFSSGECHHLTDNGCSVHHKSGNSTQAPIACKLYPFARYEDDLILLGTCLHVGDIIDRLTSEEAGAVEAVSIIKASMNKWPSQLTYDSNETKDWRVTIKIK